MNLIPSFQKFYNAFHLCKQNGRALAGHALLFFVLLMAAPTAFAQRSGTRIDLSTIFSSTNVYTVTSASPSGHREMCVDLSQNHPLRTTLTIGQTSENFQFVFVPGTGDKAGNYYLYNVGTERFVTYTTSNIYPIVGNRDFQPIYVYTHDNPKFTAEFPYVLAFNDSVTFGNNNGSTDNSNSTQHVFQLGQDEVHDNDWTFIGDGGNNSLAITAVPDVTFSAAQLAFAREILNGYPKSTWEAQAAKITPTTKVYTLQDENGQYLSANASGLTTSGTADANAQFVFFTDPEDNTKIYLYSVGQNKFVTSSKTLTNTRSSVAPINVFSTSDPHGFNLSFAFAETWTVANAVGSRTTSSTQTYRYKVSEVAGATYNQTFARCLLRDGALTLADIGIEAGQAYSMYGQRAALRVNDQETQLITRSNNNNTDGPKLTKPNNPHDQFVFFTDPTDDTKVYLYNVKAEKFVNKSGTLTTGVSDPIYIFSTRDATYPYVFTFEKSPVFEQRNGTPPEGQNSNYVINGGTQNTININNWSVFDEGNKFVINKVDGITVSTDFIANIYKNTYDPALANISAAGLTTDNVYTLTSESGSILAANSSGLTTSTTANANTQFVFVADPKDAAKVYLYSVGQEMFLTTSKTWGAGNDVAQLYTFSTNDPDRYTLALSVNGTWKNGLISVSNLSDADKTTRFMPEAVTGETQYNAQAAKKFLTGAYDKTEYNADGAGITPNTKVYTLKNEAGVYLSASASGLTTSASADDANTQFVFYQDASAPTKTYLFSVGQGKFVTTSKTLTNSASEVGELFVFKTSDADGYPLAFGFNQLWDAEGNTVIGTDNTTPAKSNRFQLTDVTSSANYDPDFAKIIYDDSYERVSYLSEVGLEAGKVYNLYSGDYVLMNINNNGTGLDRNNCNNLNGVKNHSQLGQSRTHFAFVTDESDSSIFYLYNVGARKGAKSDGTLGVGADHYQRVYLYKTHDNNFPIAISFAESWNASGAVCIEPRNTNRDVSSTVTPSASNRLNFILTADASYKMEYARNILKDERPLVDFSKEIQTTKVYTISCARGKLTVSGNQLAKSDIGSTIDDNQKFAFITDPDNPGKYYLYNVGQQQIVMRDKNLGSGSNNPIYAYYNNNTTYPYTLAFSDNLTWGANGGSGSNYVINTSGSNYDVVIDNYSKLDDGNQYVFTEVEGATYDTQIANAVLKGWMTTDLHYTGVHERPLVHKRGTNADVKYQDVSEVHYYYYVDTKRSENNNEEKTITFKLPLIAYQGDGSNGKYEPKGYFRWYDYRVDSIKTNGNLVGCGSALSIKYNVDGHALGYFATHTGPPCHSLVGAYYKIPDEANSASWQGDIIACDVSRYVDYNTIIGSNGKRVVNQNIFEHEPTLSIRYVFHILPAAQIANAIRDSLCNNLDAINKGRNRAYTDQGVLAFGAKDISASMNIRCDLQDIKQYYFHPVKAGSVAKKHVVYNDDAHKFDENDFEEEVVQAERIELRVYSEDKSHFRYVGSDNTSPTLAPVTTVDIKIGDGKNPTNSPYSLTGNHWQDLNSTGDQNLDADYIGFDKSCYLVGYVTNIDGTKKCPFYCARLDITKNSPLEQAKLPVDRREEYMTTNYGNTVANFQFDDENELMTQTAPAGMQTPDNVSHIPSPFSWRQYSFHYVDLKDFSNVLGYNTYMGDYSLLHGDFLLYKSYDRIPHDRTYQKTSGTQSGYFLMTDASDEARVLATQDFSGHLCVGSKIYISAWVANQTGETQTKVKDGFISVAQPELRFNLIGVKKNDAGEDEYTKPLASICSGSFLNNINGYVSGNTPSNDWYQVYGVITLPASSGVQGFTDFRIAIDNYCKNTNGADYAIDDIQVYQRNAKLTVIQIPALCKNTDPEQVDIKIKANLATLQSVTSANASNGDQVVYYRFVDADGNPVVGTDKDNGFYGTDKDGKPANDYGYAVVPATYDATEKLPATYGNDETNLFETGVDGQPEVVLVNNGFKLERGKQYYVSLGLPAGEGESKTISWGSSDDVCSSYSDMFSLIEQQIQIAGSSGTTTSVIVPCGKDTTMNYKISLQVTAPDKVNGGLTVLDDVHFYWFIGTNEEYNGSIKSADENHTLATAVSNYMAVYGSKAFSENDEAPAQTNDKLITYTAKDKELIKANIYDATDNPKGKLLANYTTALEGSMHSLPTGTSSVIAIPADKSVTRGGVTYALCDDYQVLTVRGLQNGPDITLGIPGVNYPAAVAYRSIRLGLPQIREMGATGELRIPITQKKWKANAVTDENLQFVAGKDESGNYIASADVVIFDTNDPSLRGTGTKIANLTSYDLANTDDYLCLRFVENAASLLHEGYWYEVALEFIRTNVPSTDADGNNCPGATYLTFKIVPEYLTWSPNSVTTSNWNIDANWRRSTAQELYNPEYEDYRQTAEGLSSYEYKLYSSNGEAQSGTASATARNPLNAQSAKLNAQSEPKSYVPMYFSKVTIPALTQRSYPMLPPIVRNAAGLILRMLNGKGENPAQSSSYIQYDMMAMGSGVSGTDSIYTATNFDGNICQQILFKPRAQMRQQQFLRYQKAWVEIEMPVNTWSTFTTLMKGTPSGDLYVPKFSARQTTPAFQEISFTDTNQKWKLNAATTTGQDATTTTNPYVTASPANDGTLGLFGAVDDKGGSVKTTLYSRMRMPVYQKLWGQNSASEYPENGSEYKTYDEPQIMLIDGHEDNDLNDGENNSSRNAWSHAFNAMADAGTSTLNQGHGTNLNGMGIAVKVGDNESTITPEGSTSSSTTKSGNATALMRLPKSDSEYKFYKWEVNGNSGKEVESTRAAQTVDPTTLANRYRLGVDYTTDENSLATITLTTPVVYPNVKNTLTDGTLEDNPNGLHYVLIGNPYTASILVNDFIDANKNVMTPVERDGADVYCVWVLEDNVLKEYQYGTNNNRIGAGEAFFVKVNEPGKDQVYFTTRMQTDPNINVTRLAREYSLTPSRVYTVENPTDVEDIIASETEPLLCTSPQTGYLRVRCGKPLARVMVYSASGTLLANHKMANALDDQFFVGSGIAIVRAIAEDGTTQSRKIVVK